MITTTVLQQPSEQHARQKQAKKKSKVNVDDVKEYQNERKKIKKNLIFAAR
jgi:hypothetical protein